MEYGLIGAKLGHSYSKIIHEAVCGYSYELHPLPTEEEAHAFMQAKAFKAINVTIPYKKLVIPYCDEVEPRAAAIGAVNTVVNRDGKLYGYNTDYTGFAYLARCFLGWSPGRFGSELYGDFFFQAEDGIRVAQESRGLGDVYKRQQSGCGVRRHG